VLSESGQATVEWVALVLLAALVLGAAAALAGRGEDHGLGEALAKRITGAAAAAPGSGPPAAAPGSGAVGPRRVTVPPRSRAAPRARSLGSRAADALRRLRGVAGVAKHAWIVCLGYERWRHELEHPSAPTEALPVDVAVSIVNTCFNPHDYLLGED
jgi:hypothetical protein